MEKYTRPEFGKAFWGINQKQANDYMSQLESELEIADIQLAKGKKELDEMRAAAERMNNQLESARSDVAYLQEENSSFLKRTQELEDELLTVKTHQIPQQENNGQLAQMQSVIDELTAKLEASQASLSACEKENRTLAQQVADQEEAIQNPQSRLENGQDPQTIQDAILSAQRMSRIILSEANEKAVDLQASAEMQYKSSMEAMEQELLEKQRHADGIVADAEKKCEDLREEYDRILLDVSGFKQEMIGLYRKHLQMLYLLPDNGNVQGDMLTIESAAEETNA